jgi:glycosyltransferase involved in cell wall biosynthesis
VPTIFTAHGWGFAERGALASRLIYIPCEKLAARYTDRLVCVSQYLYDVALAQGIAPASRLVVIRNGVETVDGPREPSSDGAVRILFVGRLVSQKDPETLLRAYASLPDAIRSRTRLRIIGEGDKRPGLEAFIAQHGLADRVELLGAVERQTVLNELLRSDLFVLTTHYEGLPRTALEAMHAGLPVIASDVWGVKELFEADPRADDGEMGILVRERSVQDVRDALERLVAGDALRREMGEAARRRARRLFSVDRMVADTLRVYEEVLE